MSWLEPKTNWQSDDYINIEDFNRIRNNIEYLKEEANELYAEFGFSTTFEKEKTYSDYPYSEVWNSLENALQDIVDNTYPLVVGDKKVFAAYDSYIDFNELNRLESACLQYHELFARQHLTVETLSFTLGNYGGIKI